MRETYRKSVEWEVGGRPFCFITDDRTGELRTPDGQVVILSLDEWHAFALGLGKVAPGKKGRTRKGPPADAPNQGSRWSLEDDAHLTSRWEQGADVEQLSEEFGRGSGGITARLVRLGLVEDRQEARRRQGSLDPAA
jgi:hypothetical protein